MCWGKPIGHAKSKWAGFSVWFSHCEGNGGSPQLSRKVVGMFFVGFYQQHSSGWVLVSVHSAYSLLLPLATLNSYMVLYELSLVNLVDSAMSKTSMYCVANILSTEDTSVYLFESLWYCIPCLKTGI